MDPGIGEQGSPAPKKRKTESTLTKQSRIMTHQERQHDPTKIVHLNVGREGKFTTTVATLNQSPTIMAKLSSEKSGTVVEIDRDDHAFKIILRYLRTKVLTFPESFQEREWASLVEEAKYYGLTAMQKALEEGAGKMERVKFVVLTPEREATNVGVDIFLQMVTIHQNPKSWMSLVQDSGSSLDFTIRRAEQVRVRTGTGPPKVHTVKSDYGVFRDKIQDTIRAKVEGKDILFNSTDPNAEFKLIAAFLKLGFVKKDSSLNTNNPEHFGKTYKMIKTMTFQRIKSIVA